ncbi:hypothetical protein MMC17_005162 [Xylographa soralifera]|nr:hypothetical protein [Xylographa soralifera]
MKKLTRTDGFVTVESFVGIVIGINIVVFAGVVEVVGELETKKVEAVLDGAELLLSEVLDNVVEKIVVVDGPDVVTSEGTVVEGTAELLVVMLNVATVVPIWVLATELAERVVIAFEGSAELLIGLIAVVTGTLLTMGARLEVKADVTTTMLENAAEVTTAAIVGVAAAAEGTLTVMPDRLAHSWTNALPKSFNESILDFGLSILLLTLT